MSDSLSNSGRLDEVHALLEIQSAMNGYKSLRGYIDSVLRGVSKVPIVRIDKANKEDDSNRILDALWLTDWESRESEYISPTYECVYGYTTESLKQNNKSWSDHIHEDDVERVKAAYYQQAELGIYDIEFRVVHPDGTIHYIHERAFPVYEEGKVVRMAGYSEDVTNKDVSIKIDPDKKRKHEIIETESDRIKDGLFVAIKINAKQLSKIKDTLDGAEDQNTAEVAAAVREAINS